MKATRLVLPVLLVAALAGCDDGAPPTKTDPREGRVTITWSNCLYGSCIYDWKICIGPDLETHLDGKVRTTKDSSECAR